VLLHLHLLLPGQLKVYLSYLSISNLARPAGFEPATLGLAYQLRLSTPRNRVCGLDYLFTISGAARIVSTDPFDNLKQT